MGYQEKSYLRREAKDSFAANDTHKQGFIYEKYVLIS